MEAVAHSAACRERIEDMMKANPDFRERVDRADERDQQDAGGLLGEKGQKCKSGDTVSQASEDRGIGYHNRLSRSTYFHSRKQREMQKWAFLRQEFMWKLQGAASEVWRSLKLKEGVDVGRDFAHLDTGHRGQVIGELHRRGRVLQGSSVAVELCQFSIDEQGVDAVSRKKWDFSKRRRREPSS